MQGSETLGRGHRWDMVKPDQPAHHVVGAQRQGQGPWERRPGSVSGEGLQGLGDSAGLRGEEEALDGRGRRGGEKPPTPETPLPAPSGGGTETPVLLAVHFVLTPACPPTFLPGGRRCLWSLTVTRGC